MKRIEPLLQVQHGGMLNGIVGSESSPALLGNPAQVDDDPGYKRSVARSQNLPYILSISRGRCVG